MGRELKRVDVGFQWPINKVWSGYLNPHYTAKECSHCGGSGYSPEAKHLADLWYGYVPFKPEDRGSIPFTPDDEAVMAFATRNVTRAPEFYGSGKMAIHIEAIRLCALWNNSWSHHLNSDDINALVAADRLYDFTHTFDPVNRWKKKDPAYLPTPREVNIWSISGLGHDSINQWVCVKAECARKGVSYTCDECGGAGNHWPSPEAKQTYEDWEPTEPPAGDGYQIWETVSEGSPISPVFATPELLAGHMTKTKWGADKGTPYETWLAFIRGPGWAPSMVIDAAGIRSGVRAMAV